MQLQAKYIKTTWLSTHGGGFRDNIMGFKKRSSDGKYMNNLIVSSLVRALKLNKKPKAKAKDKSYLEYKSEHFNFEIWILECGLNNTEKMASSSSYTNTSYVRKSLWIKNSLII